MPMERSAVRPARDLTDAGQHPKRIANAAARALPSSSVVDWDEQLSFFRQVDAQRASRANRRRRAASFSWRALPEAAYIAAVVDLRSSRHSARPLQGELARLVPADPLASDVSWRRFNCEDIADLSSSEASRQAFALRVAISLVPDVDDVPLYAMRRLVLLEARSQEAAA